MPGPGIAVRVKAAAPRAAPTPITIAGLSDFAGIDIRSTKPTAQSAFQADRSQFFRRHPGMEALLS
jgi:hypothetical protein